MILVIVALAFFSYTKFALINEGRKLWKIFKWKQFVCFWMVKNKKSWDCWLWEGKLKEKLFQFECFWAEVDECWWNVGSTFG